MIKFCVFLLVLINVAINEAKWSSYHKTRAPFVKKEILISPDSFTVIKVADGDTITVRNNSNWKLVRVRFLCIDAPETSQSKWGSESQNKLAELLPLNSKVKLAIDKIDLYGRTVAVVINSKKENVNKKMIELGLAAHYIYQRGCDEYKLAERKAKVANLGIWSDKKFMLPWDYRKKMGIGARGKNSRFANSHKKHRYESKNVN